MVSRIGRDMNSINEASPSRTEQYVHALNQISDGVIIVLADYVAPKGPRVVFANRAAAEMIGYSLEQMSRKYLGDFYDPQQLRHLIDRLPAVAKQDRVFQMEREVVKSDGQHEPLRWTICASPGSVDARMHCFVMTMRPLVQPTSEAEKPAAQPLQGSQGHHMPGKSLASPDPREATDEASLEARSRVESLAELASGHRLRIAARVGLAQRVRQRGALQVGQAALHLEDSRERHQHRIRRRLQVQAF